MNIVDFWEQQTIKWNTEKKCGFCWDFSAPLIESAVNKVLTEEDKKCCVKVMFLQDKGNAFSSVNQYANTGYVNQVTCTENFQLLVLMDSVLGLNMYNEVKGHNTSESVWETILNRLKECMQCDANLSFCDILGTQYRITNWSGVQVINYTGSNYCGYRINASFQKVS